MLIEESKLALIIIFGMLFSLAMALGMVLLSNKNRRIIELSEELLSETLQNKELEKIGAVLKTQENERTEIARQLHDEVGGLLSIVQKQILLAKSKGEKGVIDTAALIGASEFLQESIDQMRSITKELMPHYLLKLGLANALERMAQQKTNNLVAQFTFESTLDQTILLPEPIMTHNFFIASELITNLLKHSNPSYINLKLCLSISNEVLLQIQHNGVPLSHADYEKLAADSDTFGLENIRYRLALIGASIHYEVFEKSAQTTIISPLILNDETFNQR